MCQASAVSYDFPVTSLSIRPPLTSTLPDLIAPGTTSVFFYLPSLSIGASAFDLLSSEMSRSSGLSLVPSCTYTKHGATS